MRIRNRFYLALFHFQQSAEKALKPFLYKKGFMHRRISRNPPLYLQTPPSLLVLQLALRS
ncbi:MAG: HEPN domain-containing protein [Methanophagales archaeon]|nr:HEPN domain-containing protein [Methanophagales archaeon]